MANAGPSGGFLQKMFGPKKRTTDIELPNTSGKTDPRLKKKGQSTFNKVREGYSIFKGAAKKK